MGLDITALRQAKFVKDMSDENYDGYDDGLNSVWVNDQFDRHDGLVSGWYSGADEFGFRAGSYRSYSDWRNTLARIAGYPAVQRGDRFNHSSGAFAADGGPFWEMINFSDCEGVIGPVQSAKLAKDFAAFRDKVGGEDEWFRVKYEDWAKAFDMAADGGCVIFH